MKTLLDRIGLRDHLRLELQLGRQVFVNKLYQAVEPAAGSISANPFESTPGAKQAFKGKVRYEGFTLWQRKRFYDRSSTAIAKGSYSEEGGKQILSVEISCCSPGIIVFYIFVIGFYTFFFLTKGSHMNFLLFLIMTIHACLMIWLPYRLMRKSVRQLKYRLERELDAMNRR